MEKPNHQGILEEIMGWQEGRDFGVLTEEITRAEEAHMNEVPEDRKQYVLFTDGSCCVVGSHQKWKAAGSRTALKIVLSS